MIIRIELTKEKKPMYSVIIEAGFYYRAVKLKEATHMVDYISKNLAAFYAGEKYDPSV